MGIIIMLRPESSRLRNVLRSRRSHSGDACPRKSEIGMPAIDTAGGRAIFRREKNDGNSRFAAIIFDELV